MTTANSYPFGLQLGAVGVSVLYLLRGKTFNEVFDSPLKLVLAGTLPDVSELMSTLGLSSDTESDFSTAASRLSDALDDEITLLDLLVTHEHDWPENVYDLSVGAREAGMFLPYLHACGHQDIRQAVERLFSEEHFLVHLGDRTIDDCFEKPRSVFNSQQLDLLMTAQSLGVLTCVLDYSSGTGVPFPTAMDDDPAGISGNPNGLCCGGSGCQNGNVSDFCDDSTGECSAGSTLCSEKLFTSLPGGVFTAKNLQSRKYLRRLNGMNGRCDVNGNGTLRWTFIRIPKPAGNATIKVYDNNNALYLSVQGGNQEVRADQSSAATATEFNPLELSNKIVILEYGERLVGYKNSGILQCKLPDTPQNRQNPRVQFQIQRYA